MILSRRSFTHWFLLIAIAFSPAYTATSALGQALEEIIVTARQRSESLQDVPASVQVFTGQKIEDSGIQRPSDFINLTPGVTIVDAAEVGDTQVNIRGINGARDAENSFALIIDGILMTNPASLNREYTNLQQIEILKGPQGAVYGRNAAAGAIIITTQKPGEDTGGTLKVSGAEDSTYYVAGNVGGKASDTVSWGLSGDYRQTDGYYENVIDRLGSLSFAAPGGSTVDNFENWNLQGRLIFEPSDATTVDAKLRYGEVDGAAITFNAAFALPGFVALAGPAFYEQVDDHNFFFQPNIDSSNDQEALELSVKVDHAMDWGDFTGWLLYSDIENSLGSDGTSAAFQFFANDPLCLSSHTELFNISVADPSLYPPDSFSILPTPQFHGDLPVFPNGVYGPYLPSTCDGTQYQERNQEDISVEFRISSKSDQRLRWSAGFYYLTIEREVGVNLGIDTGNGINQNLFVQRTDNPLDGTFSSNNPTEQLLRDDFDTEVFALFGQLNYDITDNVEVSLALRWDQEDRDVDNTVPTPAEQVTRWISYPTPGFNLGGSPLNPGLDPNIVGAGNLNPDGSIPSQSATFDQIQPKVSLTWDMTDNTTAFTSWGVGFKSGGFNNSGSQATIDSFFNCALGIGSFFGQPFGGNPSCGDYSFAGFVIDNSQFDAWNVTDRFEEETSESFELGIRSLVLEGRLRLEAAVYHTEVDDMQFFEFTVGSFGLLRVVSNIDEVTIDGFEASADWQVSDWLSLYVGGNWVDSEIDKNSSRPDTVGNESPYTAEYTANVGGRVVFPMGGMDFFANVDWSFVGDTWFHVIQANQRPTVFGPVAGFNGFPGDVARDISVASWDRAQRDSYNTGNVRIGLETDRWTVAVFGNNVTDEEYLEEVIPAPEFGGGFIHPGTLQRWGVEGTIRF